MKRTETKIAGALRIALAGMAVLFQVLLLLLLIYALRQHATYVYALIGALSVFTMVFLAGKARSSSYTITWLLIIAVLPVFGYLLYIMWGSSGTSGRRNDRIKASLARGRTYLNEDTHTQEALDSKYPERKRISHYLRGRGFPLYQNTSCMYYPLGEQQFEAMLADMENAQKFIFMEYFILSSGVLWDRIFDVLQRKAAQGIEVRIMYDDLGSIVTAPDGMLKTLKSHNIQVVRFNPVHRYISRLQINYRNHQKITVIDGDIGYTGGTNLADEYANLYPKHGHWKDTAIRMEGDAVWSLTVTFLAMWEAESGEEVAYNRYRPATQGKGEGFFQPFADGPVNNPENPAETVYRSMISTAREYVYITTPYLIIDSIMVEALCTSALSGVDVRILTPKIWDHRYVHMVTQSNYGELLRAGVRIYEYSPGYIHAKTIISDDEHAVTGSINMDYRSFHLHYENGVWICAAPVLADIKEDILQTLPKCEEIFYEQWKKRPLLQKIAQTILRLFAVLF